MNMLWISSNIYHRFSVYGIIMQNIDKNSLFRLSRYPIFWARRYALRSRIDNIALSLLLQYVNTCQSSFVEKFSLGTRLPLSDL